MVRQISLCLRLVCVLFLWSNGHGMPGSLFQARQELNRNGFPSIRISLNREKYPEKKLKDLQGIHLEESLGIDEILLKQVMGLEIDLLALAITGQPSPCGGNFTWAWSLSGIVINLDNVKRLIGALTSVDPVSAFLNNFFDLLKSEGAQKLDCNPERLFSFFNVSSQNDFRRKFPDNIVQFLKERQSGYEQEESKPNGFVIVEGKLEARSGYNRIIELIEKAKSNPPVPGPILGGPIDKLRALEASLITLQEKLGTLKDRLALLKR